MSASEWRAGGILATIFGLRMLGLFLVLPVFSIYAAGLPGGEDFQRVAWAFGIFMLVQACLYLPVGLASDRFGRKPVIVAGLLLFAAGAVLAAWAPTIHWLIAARAMQGAGAISAAVMALAADLTREQHRTKVMALIGSSIGLVFAVSLVSAPALYGWIGMPGMFLLIAALALGAIGLVLWGVPDVPRPQAVRQLPLRSVLRDGGLLRLNFGIFVLHAVQTALFLVVPRELLSLHQMPASSHWQIYLPVVLGSFVFAVPAIMQAERHGRARPIFLGSILVLLASQLGLFFGMKHFAVVVLMLLLFFAAFNVLEASLPAMASRMAPTSLRGAAMGVFNTTQALGVASGSAAGGWIAVHSGTNGVHVMTVTLALVWALLAWGSRLPSRRQGDGNMDEERERDRASAVDAVLRAN
ncbi:MAG: MFS transporter [Rhodocyclaceae bacterium]